ncbi:MAG: hypothetical protein KAJ55_04405, partial [Anaerolineales bacterium]|nr:hypothetical protein [Anaerolineales bacterium]
AEVLELLRTLAFFHLPRLLFRGCVLETAVETGLSTGNIFTHLNLVDILINGFNLYAFLNFALTDQT